MNFSRRQVLAQVAAAGAAVCLPIRSYADPITFSMAAAYVGKELLSGAIQYVGGKIMAQVLGDPTISDVKAWIQEAVAELEAYVSAALDAKVIEQMQADLESVNTRLHEYAALRPANQKTNRHLIEVCNDVTSGLLPLSLNYDQALFITTATMGYRLFSLYALYQLDKDPGHIAAAKDTMDDFVIRTMATRDKIAKSLDPSTLAGGCGRHDITIGPIQHQVTHVFWNCNVSHNGQVIWAQTFRDTSEAAARAQFAAQLDQDKKQFTALYDGFLGAINPSIASAVLAYQDMCRKIGKTYTPPMPIHSALNPQVENGGNESPNPVTIKMPGAVVTSVVPDLS